MNRDPENGRAVAAAEAAAALGERRILSPGAAPAGRSVEAFQGKPLS